MTFLNSDLELKMQLQLTAITNGSRLINARICPVYGGRILQTSGNIGLISTCPNLQRRLQSSLSQSRRANMKLWSTLAGKFGRTNFPDWIESWGPKPFYHTGYALVAVAASSFVVAGVGSFVPYAISAIVGGYWYVGITDMRQVRHANNIGPELHQYIIEGPLEGVPYTKEERSMAYARSKPSSTQSMPFGTRLDVNAVGYEWCAHSFFPTTVPHTSERTIIGGKDCLQKYNASLLNISGMSYGALSSRAILALNSGAKRGHFYHNTGEGGLSPYHLENGGDLVWNIGTGYFGCRTMDGKFDAQMFAERATKEQVKMIELKMSQGAKPGHGGLLPADKITKQISEMRNVPMGEDCVSPPFHTAYPPTPEGLLSFIVKLRNLSGGKPIGIKLCVGRIDELASLIHAMQVTGIKPDFITVDGGEGGTGAAPVEFSNSVGMPMLEGLTLVNGLLRGAGIRQDIKVIASGKILSGFSMIRAFALGADICNSARAFLFSLGCIQALKCNSNKCPTGITTSDPDLMQGLDVIEKSKRVYRFHNSTLHVAMELVGAMGLDDPHKLEPRHVMKRISTREVASYEELYPSVSIGSLVAGEGSKRFQGIWDQAVKDAEGRNASQKA
ncbi:hypothetical protein HK100_009524 [Physocladia obscura]|uniref:Glutamate synthase domain-containing protein n=1 Tax=Physocladia obscura TaxID=109957 RepID=A0AAD5T375_9FUNG|nr:hypothetical protein HK100_009524 [Physocladia obscura]